MSYKRFLSDYGIYHVYNRGNNKEHIFKYDKDKNMFLKIVKAVQNEYNFVLYGQSIMSNHFHMVIKDNKQNLPNIIGLIEEDYAIYYNKEKIRTGQVFENPFKSKPVADIPHLFTLICYVANNPVVAGIVFKYSDYLFSSRYHLGYDKYNLVDYLYINSLSMKYNQMPIDEYILLHKSKGCISSLEVERLIDSEAQTIFNAICHSFTGNSGFNKTSLSQITMIKIIKEAYYHGLSIRQLINLTGMSEYFIKMNKESEKPYI